MKTLTAKKALSLLAEVVVDLGSEHRYEKVKTPGGDGCAYVQDGEDGKDCPSCLVGHVLHRYGVPLEFLKETNFCGAETMCARIRSADSLSFDVSRSAGVVLLTAQESQDNGETWGTALAKAVRAFGDLED